MTKPEDDNVRERAMNAVSGWLTRYLEIPGFRDWKNQSIKATLLEGVDEQSHEIEPFPHPDKIINEHNVISSYLNLLTALQDMAEMEYYFRRYPFQDLPVSRSNHLRHTCEAFFSKIYTFEERLAHVLNQINSVISPAKLNVSSTIKSFQKTFKKERRERNDIHHHTPYKDIEIDQISMINLLKLSNPTDARGATFERFRYRKISRDWASRVKSRTNAASKYVDAVGYAMLEHCDFLQETDKLRNE